MPLPARRIRARLVYKSEDAREMEMILHYAVEGGAATTPIENAVNMIDALSTSLAGAMKAVLPEQAQYLGIAGIFHHGGAVYPALSRNGAGFGIASGDQLPDSDAVLIRKLGGGPVRSGNGRWYVGCIAEGNTDGGQLTDAALVTYTTLAVSLQATVTIEGTDIVLQPLHVSRKLNSSYTIEGTFVQRNIKRQDRRHFRTLLE